MVSYLAKLANRIEKHQLFTHSAALAFYLVFALGPILIMLLTLLGLFNVNIQYELIETINRLTDDEISRYFERLIQRINERPDLTSYSGWIAAIGLMFSASLIFVRLRDSFRLIFNRQLRKEGSRLTLSIRGIISERFFSFISLLAFLLVFVMIGVLSTLLRAILTKGMNTILVTTVDMLLNIIIATILFTAVYKFFSSLKKIKIKLCLYVGLGASVLFNLGKTLLNIYLKEAAIGSIYGAAGSFLLLLVWVYYSAFILYFGAEVLALLIEKSEES